MSVVINTNTAATAAAINFSSSNTQLQKSLSRLSSGTKIVNPADDAGGLAVSMKMTAALTRTAAVKTNVANSISYLQTQDGSLKTAGDILNRMSELATLYNDVTKSTSDKANYQTEFKQLQQQLSSVDGEAFNGVSLFGSASLTINISEDGTRTVDVAKPDLAGTDNYSLIKDLKNWSLDGSKNSSNVDTSKVSLSMITGAIQEIATFRAQNGAYSSRLQFADNVLTINKQNLESANSQIVDVDVASESTAYAKYNILVQSGAAMLAQANASSQIALKLISG